MAPNVPQRSMDDDAKHDPFVDETASNTPASKRPRGVGFIHIIIIWVLISLLAVNIAVLYVIHYHDKPPTPSFTAVGSKSFTTVSGDGLSSLNEGTPVSVTEDGKIAVGAGTSFYLSAQTFADVSTKYVQNKALSADTTLVSYYNGQKTLFNITTMSPSTPREVSTAQVGSIDIVVKRVVALSSSLVMLVATNDSALTNFTKVDEPGNLMIVYPATIAAGKMTILKDKGAVVNAGLGVSASIGASALDSTRMAITMYGKESGQDVIFVTVVSINDQKVEQVPSPCALQTIRTMRLRCLIQLASTRMTFSSLFSIPPHSVVDTPRQTMQERMLN